LPAISYILLLIDMSIPLILNVRFYLAHSLMKGVWACRQLANESSSRCACVGTRK